MEPIEDTSDVYDPIDYAQLTEELLTIQRTTLTLDKHIASIQQLIDQETLNYETDPVKLAPGRQIRLLLKELALEEEGITIGSFLKALNRYLVKHELVDYKTLQIQLSPVLRSACKIPVKLKTVPYSMILLALPCLFNLQKN